jgi:[ribosomal protein S5]-alanine N-acetyltransferase
VNTAEARLVMCLRASRGGFGYATEATRRLLAFGFNELGLHKIFATCDPENRASVAVLPKNGMDQEGVLPSWRL